MKTKGFAKVFLPVTTAVLVATGAVALSVGETGSSNDCDPELTYCPSAIQEQVDRSFSNIRIDTPLAYVSSRLSEIHGECHPGECEWHDSDRVRHYAFYERNLIVVKAVRAEEFVGRSISALGIGMARHREDVIRNTRNFLGAVELECRPYPSSEECNAFLDPGWVWIRFDGDGQLVEVHFDGYHFT